MENRSYFADELNAVLDRASLSVEEIVNTLNWRGFPLPLRTFNYWRHGYFLPRSNSAFPLVDALEEICAVPDNRLSNALLRDLSSGASFIPGDTNKTDRFVGNLPSEDSERFTSAADKTVDWEANLIQKAVRDECWVSADYKTVRHTVTVLARVPSVPNPQFIFQVIYDEDEKVGGEDFFYNLSGITFGGQQVFTRDDGKLVCVTRFSLPDTVVPGDLYRLSYSWDVNVGEPMTKLGERFFPFTLDFYSSAITFEGAVPDDIRYDVHVPVGDKEVESSPLPCSLKGNTVMVSTKDVGNVIGSFRFTPKLS